MDSLKLIVPGKPMGKQRARYAKRKGYVATITPDKTVNYETLIRELFALNYPGFTPIDGPVTVQIYIHHPIPKSTSVKKRQAMILEEIRPTVKPDIDNVIKIVCDALNGVAYVDDNQIITVRADKYFSDWPRVEIVINEWLVK